MSVAHTNDPIITEAAFKTVLTQARPELDANPGRSILNIVLAADNAHFHLSLDPRPDQPGLIDASLARAQADGSSPPDAREIQFAEEIKRIWAQYDHQELVMCLLSVGQATQITCRPKPWIKAKNLHEHCSCGFRRGAFPEHDAAHLEAIAVGDCDAAVAALFKAHRIPEPFGAGHARLVLAHTRGALEAAKEPPGPTVRLAMMLAALLVAADAPKYFGKTARRRLAAYLASAEAKDAGADADDALARDVASDTAALEISAAGGTPYPNAAKILAAALSDHPQGAAVTALALEAIAVANEKTPGGGPAAPMPRTNPFVTYPRHACGLEAIGEPGVASCWKYCLEEGVPLYTDNTPSPRTTAEVFAISTPERLALFRGRKGSESLVDHILDRTLHRLDPLVHHDNAYFSSIARIRILPLVEVCTASRPDALRARLEMAEARVLSGAI
jgi:hypothetical protein